MRLGPLINIHITPARLGLNTEPASMQLQQQVADIELQQPAAELEVRYPTGRLHIDQSAVWQELGTGSLLVSAREQAAAGIRRAQAGAARLAREGDRMMLEPEVIGSIAQQRNYAQAHVETNVGLLPRSRPDISYIGDPRPSIEATPQAPRWQATPRPPQLVAAPAVVQTYLQQKDSIEIEYVGPRQIWA